MRKAVRRTKEMLTPNEEAPFHVEELHNGIDFSTTITRAALEELAGVRLLSLRLHSATRAALQELAGVHLLSLRLHSATPAALDELAAVHLLSLRLHSTVAPVMFVRTISDCSGCWVIRQCTAVANVDRCYCGTKASGALARCQTLESCDRALTAGGTAGDYWAAVKEPLATLIERNNLGAGGDGISVQLLGGGSRVPRVRAELQAVHENILLEKNLDASEAFALGGGLFAANLSTTFRLRPFGMLDVSPFGVSVTVDAEGGLPEGLAVRCPLSTR